MPRLIWSAQALLDVQRLYRFLAHRNPEAARRAVKTLREGLGLLARRPELGRPIEYMPEIFREWLIDFGDSGYVARYHITTDVITILAVEHQKESGFRLPS